MELDLLDRLLQSRRAGQAAALVTHLASGKQMLIEGDSHVGTLVLAEASIALVKQTISEDRSVAIETPAGDLFVEVWNPPLRIILVGAVHIAQALAPIAVLAGYKVLIIDPRNAFAAEHRFSGVEIRAEWPDDVLNEIKPDKRTAIVTLSHDPKIDDPALHSALRSAAFYIGSLGSRRTHAKRLERLEQAGFDKTALSRIRGPTGLDIGAITPAEIAVSIIAEITSVLRAGRIKAKALQ